MTLLIRGLAMRLNAAWLKEKGLPGPKGFGENPADVVPVVVPGKCSTCTSSFSDYAWICSAILLRKLSHKQAKKDTIIPDDDHIFPRKPWGFGLSTSFFPRKNDCEVGWSLADAWKKYAQKLLDGDLPGCQPVAKRSSGMDQPPPRNQGGWYRFGIVIRDV